MGSIARQLGLDWDVEFRFVAADLDEAARRTATLARAVDRALSLVYAPLTGEIGREKNEKKRPESEAYAPRTLPLPFPAPALSHRLGAELLGAGLRVAPRAQILTGSLSQPVTVDYRVERGAAEAAVEVLSARRQPRALMVVDRTVADFHMLERGAYRGLLIAVYDEEGPAAQTRLLDRFVAASPVRTILVPSGSAALEIQRRLAA